MDELKTYRAATLQDALELVRTDLGPEASVLHTREAEAGWWNWMIGRREIEVVASAKVAAPSRFASLRPAARRADDADSAAQDALPLPERSAAPAALAPAVPPADALDYRAKFRDDLKSQAYELESMVDELSGGGFALPPPNTASPLEQLIQRLRVAGHDEPTARELGHRVLARTAAKEDAGALQQRLARLLAQELPPTAPIALTPGRCRVVALVGPTGVGKTTTVAKLAANFRLQERARVGLITVDTYRIAAIDQLRTYAEIIDLPMEVVATPGEMRAAAARLRELDLVLIDTAGRSPRDEIKLQELKALLVEAQADEIHLVQSCAGSAAGLVAAAERFATVGCTSLLLTKLDEAAGYGNVGPLLARHPLPLSYFTYGQNVPHDIDEADRRWLARALAGLE